MCKVVRYQVGREVKLHEIVGIPFFSELKTLCLLIKSEKSSKHVAFLADELLKRWDLVGRTDGQTDGRTDGHNKEGAPSSVRIMPRN